jgi:membrane-associated protease RseP (regulator of RpoE activity)
MILPIFLFVLTFFTATFKENLILLLFQFDSEVFFGILKQEYPYSVSLLGILFAHEMGHYLPARYYGIKATLPTFIPFPFGPVGTMGAVIQIKEPIPDKRKLFDIGVGGPVMSLILSSIAWVVGLHYSELISIQDMGENLENALFFGDSLFTYYTGKLVFGDFNPELFEIQIHPLAKAGWVGLLITAINLLPFGQLDGGHVIYALFGENYRKWIYYLFIGFIFLAFVHFTWLVWGFLIFYAIKVEHPFVKDSYDRTIGKFRIFLGYFILLSLILIFTPKPIYIGSEKDKPNLGEDIIQYLIK